MIEEHLYIIVHRYNIPVANRKKETIETL